MRYVRGQAVEVKAVAAREGRPALTLDVALEAHGTRVLAGPTSVAHEVLHLFPGPPKAVTLSKYERSALEPASLAE